MKKFKVGDKIRLKDQNQYYYLNGDEIGTIIEISVRKYKHDHYVVTWDKTVRPDSRYGYNEENLILYMDGDYFDFCEKIKDRLE